MLDKLKARLEELETTEAQAIHNLGFVAGRIQEVKDLIAECEAESDDERPSVERGGKVAEVAVMPEKPEKR